MTESSTRMKSTPHGYGLIHPNTIFLFEKKPVSVLKAALVLLIGDHQLCLFCVSVSYMSVSVFVLTV